MKTYRLWLEKDSDLPQFRRLRFEQVEVSLKRVLLEGIHPHGATCSEYSRYDASHLSEKLIEIMNLDEFKIQELCQFSYCGDITVIPRIYYTYGRDDEDELEGNFKHIRESILFTDKLSYIELLELAKKKLKEKWDHNTARELLTATHYSFNSARSFVKTKDKKVKLSGYRDLDNYPLHEILTLEDFQDYEDTIISHGIKTTNFRQAKLLDKVTTRDGLLRLVPEFLDFQLKWELADSEKDIHITYNCQRKGNEVKLIPELSRDEMVRGAARETAARWSEEKTRYNFSLGLEKLEEMVGNADSMVLFPNLNYKNGEMSGNTSVAEIKENGISHFIIGHFAKADYVNECIQEHLRNHDWKVSGKKGELLQRLIELAVELYREKEPLLDRFFRRKKFIRVPSALSGDDREFPCLEEFDLKNLMLSMYAIRHMRGNTILDASYLNDTLEIEDLAKALVMGSVTMDGAFLKVE